VLDSVSRVGTPLPELSINKPKVQIIYHQWGFVRNKKIEKNLIEDSVDTLYIQGTRLFPNGGQFEVWSLSKILGTSSGGVLWCRSKKIAKQIRKSRDMNGGGFFPWILRIFSRIYPPCYYYWQGIEANLGKLFWIQTFELKKAISNWDFIVADRIKKLDLIWPYACDFLEKPKNRLPTAVPVKCNLPNFDVINLGILSGYRIFQRHSENKRSSFEKVLPIPIHQDVSFSWLAQIIKKLDLK
jgi:putative PLP-dependent aminotransferase (TIGR04422 family)